MSTDWWIVPSLALGSLTVILWGILERFAWPGESRPGIRRGYLVAALLLLVVVAFVGPIWDGWLRRENRDLCFRHLNQLGFALLLYVQDHDERFPRALDWCDVAEPGLPNEDSFRCPADRPGRGYSYGMNSAVSLRTAAELSEDRLILLFESNQGVRNAYGGEQHLAPLTRHNPVHLLGLYPLRPDPAEGGHFFAFTDGHVEWLTPAERRTPGRALWEGP